MILSFCVSILRLFNVLGSSLQNGMDMRPPRLQQQGVQK